MEEQENSWIMKYSATSFARFSMLLAFLDAKNLWRLRFRAVLTPAHGLLIFKLKPTLHLVGGRYKLPEKDSLNTIALIGLKPDLQPEFTILTKIYAKGMDGQNVISSATVGDFGWQEDGDIYQVSNYLDGHLPFHPIRYFDV